MRRAAIAALRCFCIAGIVAGLAGRVALSLTVSPNASDALSGVDTQSCGALDSSTVGLKTVTCTATDKAGNTGSATPGFTVQYSYAAMCYGDAAGRQILQPINVDGSSVFKQGSTVPAKFRACDANGVSIGTPDTAFRWSSSDQLWIFNISTKTQVKNVTYIYLITLNDGSTIHFQFALK